MTTVRSIAFNVAFYLWTLTAAIVCMPLLLAPYRVAQATLNMWAKVVTWQLRVIGGVRVEVRGREHLPTGPALVAPKHQCMFDIFGTIAVLPAGCYVLRKELMRIPVFSWWAWKCRMVVIDREGGSQALRRMLTDSRERLAAAPRQIVIFPEGTRGKPGMAGDYQPGVAALYRDLDLPCTPVALNSGMHWQKGGMALTPGTIVFEFLEPLPAGMKRPAFMQALETRLEAASNALIAEGI
ncbi:MAG TPA: lysophospholipid acyltransferase family protein [Caulobacteraceae bacterium]|nr:lysophospholipid acyltransferase family protein [Caulobacteraceae bacterium]